ncbi:MAG TPA: GAF domain-containing protein [Gaiellaceae bacterium]|nr:GAF domain-containing protein [Gaiellaceae bacterium]
MPVYAWLLVGFAAGLASAAVAVLLRRRSPRPSLGGPDAGRREPARSLSAALVGASDVDGVAQALLEEVERLGGVDVTALALVDEERRLARGCLARVGGREQPEYRDVVYDLEHEPSGVATAAFEAVPFAVFDASPSARETKDGLAARSAAYVPLVVEQRVFGVLVLGTTAESRAFTSDELRLVEAIAREAALALDRARSTSELGAALERERRRLVQQSALLRAAQALASDLRFETVLQRLVEHVAELFEADAADCYLLDHDRAVFRCAAVHGLPRELVGFEFPADRGLAARALHEGRPVSAAAYAELDAPVPGGAYAGFTEALVAPLRWGERVQGVLSVGTRGDRSFSDEDADLVEAYAGLAALALANAQAFDARSRQASVQRGFFRIASVLGQSLSLEATLEALAQAAAEALGGASAAVLMPHGATLQLAGASGLAGPLRDALADDLPQSASVLRSVAHSGRILASADTEDDDRFAPEWKELARRAGFRALIGVPVASPREDTNALVLVCFPSPRAFLDDDLELARHLADAARGALERSELFEAERTARTLSQQLAHTGGVLATELDPAAVLEEVVQQAPALLSADACAIRTVENDELVVSAASGEGADDAVGTRTPATAWLSGDVAQSRGPVAINDVGADERLIAADPIVAAGHRAFLGVPLSGPEGALHGVLAVYVRRPRTWRSEEVEALQALAANTSAALSNAELYSRVSLEKERSVAILANIADGIVAVDRDGEVVLWNAAAEEITGVPAEEALGRTPVQVLQRSLESEDDTPQLAPRLVSITRGGEEVWLSLSEAVMRDPLGAVAGRIFAFRDISADRMVEEIKSDFVAAVSHELRTPLTSIYGFAETLLRQDVLFGEEERRTFIEYIALESRRLSGIVDQLLNVARLDAGDLHVEPGSIDVAAVVSDVLESASANGMVDGHRFEVDLPSEPLAAEADGEKLRQVVSILVENALKYSPAGGTVTVAARRKEDTVEVRVVDEGIGIPLVERERIFRKFYRAESTVRDGGGGTGLGLFIAKELVTAMGGRIWVESEEGGGSSFTFELPAHGLEAAAGG